MVPQRIQLLQGHARVTAWLGRTIALEMSGDLRFRAITAAVQDGAVHRLTISSNLGEPVAVETKVHFLSLVRSDSDRIEIEHGPASSEVILLIVEVPE